jgi:hypothetical protein
MLRRGRARAIRVGCGVRGNWGFADTRTGLSLLLGHLKSVERTAGILQRRRWEKVIAAVGQTKVGRESRIESSGVSACLPGCGLGRCSRREGRSPAEGRVRGLLDRKG